MRFGRLGGVLGDGGGVLLGLGLLTRAFGALCVVFLGRL